MSLVHLNFDVETLGKREGAVVTTLSCVPFSFEKDTSYDDLVLSGFYVKFDIKEQIQKYHRSTCSDTIQWWKEQSQEARENSILPSDADVSLEEGLGQLTAFIKGSGYNFNKSYVWCRGNYFDFPKIEDIYRCLGLNVPFNTWKIRDTRTYIDILTGVDNGGYTLKGGTPSNFVHHHALHDAALDVARMLEIYRAIQSGD